ncbi:hypothetical protein NL676_021326 [Syzygium grande]|nr:hypothetical protein NL676_021326 [Syzygium grande]
MREIPPKPLRRSSDTERIGKPDFLSSVRVPLSLFCYGRPFFGYCSFCSSAWDFLKQRPQTYIDSAVCVLDAAALGQEISSYEEFKTHMNDLLASQESRLGALEAERDRFFELAVDMSTTCDQCKRANLHMDGHLRDFVMGIRSQFHSNFIMTM